ncbi:MAG: RNA polymerase sigma factor [Planctomycetota bacterium]
MDDDLDLVRRIATGDAEALAALYDRRGADAFRLARRVLLDAQRAEEVTQDAFLRVWRAAGAFRGGSVASWLARIVLNLARDRLRRRRPRQQPSHDVPARDDRERRDVEAALAALPAAERMALVLRYYEGMTHRQAAMLLGVSLRTAKYRAARGLARLKEELE